eukprot:2936146-Prymnesium_polylepis.1
MVFGCVSWVRRVFRRKELQQLDRTPCAPQRARPPPSRDHSRRGGAAERRKEAMEARLNGSLLVRSDSTGVA